MEIKAVKIKEIYGLNETLFFKGNTIIMGGNSKGKTRSLKIIYSAAKGTLKKDFKNKTTSNSKLTIEYFDDDHTFQRAIYEGINLSLQSGKDFEKVCINPLFIESENIDINSFVTEAIQADIQASPEFSALKKKAESITDTLFTTINSSSLIGGIPSITNSSQDKMPKFKVELENNGIPIVDEGDGIKKALSIEILKNVDTNLALIDEIENHLSVKSINEILTSLNGKLIIASSHRIEVTNGINSVTSISNQTIPNIGAYINPSVKEEVILVEGKNDLPIIAKALKLIDEDKIIVVATNRDQAITNSNLYNVRAFIDNDKKPTSSGRILSSLKLQLENYVPQPFIDSDDKLSGIVMTDTKTISQMVSESAGFSKPTNLKNYISQTVNEWLEPSNPLLDEIKNLLKK